MRLIKSQYFHKTRIHYWSCSKFSEWCYNQVMHTKPNSATGEDWQDWEITTKQSHPIVHYFVEKVLDNVQDVVMFPVDVYDSIRVYVRNRFIDRLHLLDTKLPKGMYHELDTRLLHGAFEALVDFVEVEKAGMQCWNDNEYVKPKWFKWGSNRNPSAGIAYLNWEISLGDDSGRQSEAAQIMLDLYNWWTVVRPSRPDPWEVYHVEMADGESDSIFSIISRDPEKAKFDREQFDKMYQLENQYMEEDTQQVQKLMAHRQSMWT